MVKVKCIYGSFTVDKCKLIIDKAWSPEIIETAFKGSKSLGVGDPADGDPDMVLAKRMLGYFPNSGEILEHNYEIDPDVVY